MIQRSQNAFRSAQIGPGQAVSALDQVNLITNTNPGWSAGCTLIDIPPIQPPSTKSWEILGFAVTAKLFLQTGLACQVFGRFGKILAGMITGPAAQATQAGSLLPFTSSVLPLPTDASMIETLWDPDTDPLPPAGSNAGVATDWLDLTATKMLPNPIDLQLGQQIGIGLWIEPMLMGTLGPGNTSAQIVAYLRIINAGYTVFYDDGLPVPVGL